MHNFFCLKFIVGLEAAKRDHGNIQDD